MNKHLALPLTFTDKLKFNKKYYLPTGVDFINCFAPYAYLLRQTVMPGKSFSKLGVGVEYICYQFRVPRNLRIDIKDRLEEYSQSIEIDILNINFI